MLEIILAGQACALGCLVATKKEDDSNWLFLMAFASWIMVGIVIGSIHDEVTKK